METNASPGNQEKKKKDIKRFFRYLYLQIKRTAGLGNDTDINATIQSISKSIHFSGVNLWILAFATIIASIGLDVNSTAVIIGAMLISPLMGPINGVGLAIGISDSELLRKSLINFLLMMGISLVASTLYFLVSPLSDAQSELLARTRPTMFDVLIAFFGGLAGIVAISRKDQPFTIISGVAIATALMPPLCTAGFGLATGQLNYFLGAFYLFFINSVFIALATYLMVKFLRFPQKKYLDGSRSKAVHRYITIFTVLALTPSIFMAINVVRETAFNNAVIRYINDIQESSVFDRVELINSKKEYARKERLVTLSVVGEPLTEKDMELLNQKLLTYGLTKTKLKVKQTNIYRENQETDALFFENILDKKDQQIFVRDSIIRKLEHEISVFNNNSADYQKIASEIAIQYPEISVVSFANMTFMNTKNMEQQTLPTVFITWQSKPNQTKREQLINWLKIRFDVEEIKLIENQ